LEVDLSKTVKQILFIFRMFNSFVKKTIFKFSDLISVSNQTQKLNRKKIEKKLENKFSL